MNLQNSKQEFVKELFKIGAIKFGDFLLKSGRRSPYYIDLRLLPSYPNVLEHAGDLLGIIINSARNTPDILCGIPSAGLAIANAVSFKFGFPTIYTRKEPAIYKELAEYLHKTEKDCSMVEKPGLQKAVDLIRELGRTKKYGVATYVDGKLESGAKVGIVDDVITTAKSKIEARDLILLESSKRNVTVTVTGVFVIIDREQGGKEALKRQGLDLHSVATIRQAAAWLHDYDLLTDEIYNKIIEYTLSERKAIERQ